MGGWLTSNYQVCKAIKIVEVDTQGVIPFDIIDVDGIDGFKFEYEPLLLYLLKLFHLEDVQQGQRHQSATSPNSDYFGWSQSIL
jgi:hypothetical protein